MNYGYLDEYRPGMDGNTHGRTDTEIAGEQLDFGHVAFISHDADGNEKAYEVLRSAAAKDILGGILSTPKYHMYYDALDPAPIKRCGGFVGIVAVDAYNTLPVGLEKAYVSPLGLLCTSTKMVDPEGTNGTKQVQTVTLSATTAAAGTVTLTIGDTAYTAVTTAESTPTTVAAALATAAAADESGTVSASAGVLTFTGAAQGTETTLAFAAGTSGFTAVIAETTAAVAPYVNCIDKGWTFRGAGKTINNVNMAFVDMNN